MSAYYDSCKKLALEMLEEHEYLHTARSGYLTNYRLGELVQAARDEYDPSFHGTRRHWDELVWQVAKEAFEDAFDEYVTGVTV